MAKRKLSPGAKRWHAHLMKVWKEMKAKNPNAKFSAAMKKAARSYRK